MSYKKIILCGILGAAPLMAADDQNKGIYLQGNLGYAMGVAPGGNFEQNTLGDANVYSAAIGYKFDEHFRADFGIESRKGFTNEFAVNSRTSTNVTYTDTQSAKVQSLSSMISVYYDIATINKVTPYVMLGAGIARNKTTSNIGTISNYSNGNPDAHYSFSNGTHFNFSYKVGAGAQYSINNNMSLDLHYQYADLGKFRSGNIVTMSDGTKEVHPNLEGKLQSHEFLLGMRYKF